MTTKLASDNSLLFSPLKLRDITTKNRVVISPMMQYRAVEGCPNDFHLAHYASFAFGGSGIVFTEVTAIEPRGRISHFDCGIWNDQQTELFHRITTCLRREGSTPAIQIGHSGRKGSALPTPLGGGALTQKDAVQGYPPFETVGPTDQGIPGFAPPRALHKDEIAEMVQRFAEAARRADEAGFDILEIHGAHGYLISSFLSPTTNTRTDEYGATLEGRMRFAVEVVEAVRTRWPKHKPLFFRVSVVDDVEGGWSVDDTVALATRLKASGVDVFDCSSGGLTGSVNAVRLPRRPGFQVPLARQVKMRAQTMTMTVGLITEALQAEEILCEGAADLIAIGREALRDPFWALHAAEALGIDPEFALWPKVHGWWLAKRARSQGADTASMPEGSRRNAAS